MIFRFPGALVLGCLLVLGLSGTALAHAELLESDPAEGETIETPAQLTASFSIELESDPQRSFIVLRDSSGAEVARGGVMGDDTTTMAVELPSLPPGEYIARWQAYDPSDDHTERGTITFTVAQAAPTAPPTDEPTTPRPTPSPSPSPAPSPDPSPSPEPGADPPAAGTTDALLALVLAGVVIGGLALYLLRRR